MMFRADDRDALKLAFPMRAFRKQEHGEPNPIFREEEARILSAKDQAVACGNPQVIGRKGEVPIVDSSAGICRRRFASRLASS
jgi:hypothetical protein